MNWADSTKKQGSRDTYRLGKFAQLRQETAPAQTIEYYFLKLNASTADGINERRIFRMLKKTT